VAPFGTGPSSTWTGRGGEKTEISGIDFSLKNLSLPAAPDTPQPKGISFAGELRVKDIKGKDLALTDLDAKITASADVCDIRPFTMKLFGGKGEGGIRVDLTREKPDVQVKYMLSKFRAEESLATISQKKYLSGPMTLVPELSFRGTGAEEMKRTARGQVSLRGGDLSLHGMDIDGVLSTVEQARQMNLADVGAFLLAGPLGTAATKGYRFGGVSGAVAQGGESKIIRLVSEWTVNDGVAEAKDVAFATRKNRIAMKGKLDIVKERFVDITVALLDAKGCAKVRQKISGPFRNPKVDKVSTLETAIEPILGLFQQTKQLVQQTKQLVGRGECKPFYTGSVAQPG
jgi:AsmA protein